jgi:hypothetical protein
MVWERRKVRHRSCAGPSDLHFICIANPALTGAATHCRAFGPGDIGVWDTVGWMSKGLARDVRPRPNFSQLRTAGTTTTQILSVGGTSLLACIQSQLAHSKVEAFFAVRDARRPHG